MQSRPIIIQNPSDVKSVNIVTGTTQLDFKFQYQLKIDGWAQTKLACLQCAPYNFINPSDWIWTNELKRRRIGQIIERLDNGRILIIEKDPTFPSKDLIEYSGAIITRF